MYRTLTRYPPRALVAERTQVEPAQQMFTRPEQHGAQGEVQDRKSVV